MGPLEAGQDGLAPIIGLSRRSVVSFRFAWFTKARPLLELGDVGILAQPIGLRLGLQQDP